MKHLILIGCLIAILLTLSPLFTMQPYADDLVVQPAIRGDAWHFMVDGYYTWTGRWAFYLSYGLASQLPAWAWGWCILGFIALWWIALYRLARYYAPQYAVLGGSLLMLIGLQAVSAPREVWGWQSGFYTYGLAIILITWMVVLWLAKRTRLNTTALLVAMFILPGLNETAGALQIIVWGGLLYWQHRQHRPTRLPLWGFVVAVLSYSLIFFAPGNAVRQAEFITPGPWPALQYTLYNAGLIPAHLLTGAPLSVLGALGIALVNRPTRRQPDRALMWLLIGMALCLGSLFIGYYATGNLLAGRAQSIAEIGFLFCASNAVRDASPRRIVLPAFSAIEAKG